MKKLILFLGILSILSCKEHKTNRKIVIHTFRKTNISTNNDDALFWYILATSNNQFYYFSSINPVNDFSNVIWVGSTTLPKDFNGKEEIETKAIDEEELPEEIQDEWDQTLTEITESDSNSPSVDNENTDSEDNSGDSDSGDSGGDSGGDGGGGGE